jgi:hypothetical protein
MSSLAERVFAAVDAGSLPSAELAEPAARVEAAREAARARAAKFGLPYKEPPLFDARSDKRPDGLTVRIDTGVYEGGVISMYYDPMIAKLVTHGRTRNEAIHVIHSHHYE